MADSGRLSSSLVFLRPTTRSRPLPVTARCTLLRSVHAAYDAPLAARLPHLVAVRFPPTLRLSVVARIPAPQRFDAVVSGAAGVSRSLTVRPRPALLCPRSRLNLTGQPCPLATYDERAASESRLSRRLRSRSAVPARDCGGQDWGEQNIVHSPCADLRHR